MADTQISENITEEAKQTEQELQAAKAVEKSKKTNGKFTYAHGRRKEAAARVRLFSGRGEIIVNGKPIDEYFAGEIAKVKWQKPFVITKTEGAYHATIKVVGSGKNSQLDAVVHGLSRALISAKPELRSILKKVGLLTRDPRVRERRKYGLAQSARKGKQSPKR